MDIDPYALCPGGTGKKIKFCCPDLLAEWDKLQRMLEAEQYVACLQLIEQLERDRPDRACLMALKVSLLRATKQTEAAKAATARFLEKHPGNPSALSEAAALAAGSRGGREALGLLMQAIAASGDDISLRCYEALDVTAHALLAEGFIQAGRALLLLMLQIDKEDRHAQETLLRLNRSGQLPLLVREDRALVTAVDRDAPWKEEFGDALSCVGRARWPEAAERFAALTSQYPDAAPAWWNLAIVRTWLADLPGAIEALQRYASLDVPHEDAAEAEALALCLSEDPLGDRRSILRCTYTPDDTEQFQAAATLSKQMVRVQMAPREPAEDDEPPPKAMYLVLDRPAPDAEEELTLDKLPEVLATAELYGRQTDREARLEVGDLLETEADQVDAILKQFVGQGLRPESTREAEMQFSASRELLGPRNWFPPGTSPELARRLAGQARQGRAMGRWCDMPLGILEGKSPREAAADGVNRVRLSAVLLLMEQWSGMSGEPLELDPLRERFGLPVPGPIDPATAPVRSVPLVRLARVEAEKLSDEDLLHGLRRAFVFDMTAAIRRFSRAVLERPALADHDFWLTACQMAAHTEPDPELALQFVDRGRKAAVDRGGSSASWDLMELPIHLSRGESAEASRVFQHIEREHLSEPGVAQALAGILVDLGICHPDGTPAVPLREAVGAGQPAEAAPGQIWTADSQPAGSEKKLWMPGMD